MTILQQPHRQDAQHERLGFPPHLQIPQDVDRHAQDAAFDQAAEHLDHRPFRQLIRH